MAGKMASILALSLLLAMQIGDVQATHCPPSGCPADVTDDVEFIQKRVNVEPPLEKVKAGKGGLVKDEGCGCSANASGVTALINVASESRKFSIAQCEQEVVLQDLYPVFVAHQVEWSSMGQTMPWWSVLSGLPKSKQIPEHMKVEFYASGKRHVDEFIMKFLNAPDLQTFHNIMADPASTAEKAAIAGFSLATNYHEGRLRLLPPKKGELMPLGKVLDFGCGLGRLAFNFLRFATGVTCVDQSPFHLRQAAHEWKLRQEEYGSAGDIDFVLSSPDLLAAVNGRRFDFVHAVIVLQHMVPQLQAVYLEQFCDVLAPGGYGWLQIPIVQQKVDEACDMEM